MLSSSSSSFVRNDLSYCSGTSVKVKWFEHTFIPRMRGRRKDCECGKCSWYDDIHVDGMDGWMNGLQKSERYHLRFQEEEE